MLFITDIAFPVKTSCPCGGFNVHCIYYLKHLHVKKSENVPQNNGKRCILTAVVLRFCCQNKGPARHLVEDDWGEGAMKNELSWQK